MDRWMSFSYGLSFPYRNLEVAFRYRWNTYSSCFQNTGSDRVSSNTTEVTSCSGGFRVHSTLLVISIGLYFCTFGVKEVVAWIDALSVFFSRQLAYFIMEIYHWAAELENTEYEIACSIKQVTAGRFALILWHIDIKMNHKNVTYTLILIIRIYRIWENWIGWQRSGASSVYI